MATDEFNRDSEKSTNENQSDPKTERVTSKRKAKRKRKGSSTPSDHSLDHVLGMFANARSIFETATAALSATEEHSSILVTFHVALESLDAAYDAFDYAIIERAHRD